MSDNIFISCPTTSQPVKTGFRAPRGTDISALQQVTLQHCPACGERHIWSADAGFCETLRAVVSDHCPSAHVVMTNREPSTVAGVS